MDKNRLLAAVAVAYDYISETNNYPSVESIVWMNAALKTVNYYERVLWRIIRSFYNGEIDKAEFITLHTQIIKGQFRRAWNEGLIDAGLQPSAEYDQIIKGYVDAEFDYIVRLADQIEAAKLAGTGSDQFKSRVELWGNRYNEIRNAAFLQAYDGLAIWQYGATEEHCTDCARMRDLGAMAMSEWRKRPERPQSRDLECNGYRCDCRYEKIPVTSPNNMLFALTS